MAGSVSAGLSRGTVLADTVVVEAAPGSHLRLLAGQALAWPGPGDEFLVASAGLVAVANAYVMLGLVTEPEADAELDAAGTAMTARGLPGSWLSIRSGADGYWRLRGRGREGLSWMPRAVAVSPVRLAAGSSDLRFEWLRLARAGVRFQVQASAAGERLPPRHAGQAVVGLSLADDAANRYQMYWDAGRGTGTLWAGDVVALPEPPDDVAFFELAAAGSPAPFRVAVSAPRLVRMGTADPPWPTAAESYLALLCAQHPPAAIGRSCGRRVAAAVAEALLAVGAIPAHSPVLLQALGRDKRSAHPVLPTTWPSPVRRDTPPDMRIAIGAGLPLATLLWSSRACLRGARTFSCTCTGGPGCTAAAGRPQSPHSPSARSMTSAARMKGGRAAGADMARARDTVTSRSGRPCRPA